MSVVWITIENREYLVPYDVFRVLEGNKQQAIEALKKAEKAQHEAERMGQELAATKSELAAARRDANLPPHPTQPLYLDVHDVIRFRPNKIVQFLAKTSRFDENDLAAIGFPHEDRIQFAQLTGWSLSGFGDLSYVTSDDYAKAERAILEFYGLDDEETNEG